MTAKVSRLFIYPVKSCRSIELVEAMVLDEGLVNDRRWMIVDSSGRYMTQRSHPELARIVPSLKQLNGLSNELTLTIAHPDGRVDANCKSLIVDSTLGLKSIPIEIWNYQATALDCGAAAEQFLTDFLQQPARLVRFDPEQTRACNKEWTGLHDGRTHFADGFPILVLGESSVDDLAQRLSDTEVSVARFRPNVVIAGLPAYEEDFIHQLIAKAELARFDQAPFDQAQFDQNAALTLKLVKPCPRCSMPRVDQLTGRVGGSDPTRELATYRYNDKVKGGVLGMNAMAIGGQGTMLKVGQEFEVDYDF